MYAVSLYRYNAVLHRDMESSAHECDTEACAEAIAHAWARADYDHLAMTYQPAVPFSLKRYVMDKTGAVQCRQSTGLF